MEGARRTRGESGVFTRRSEAGFGIPLVDCFIVIAIIGIVIALFVPWLMRPNWIPHSRCVDNLVRSSNGAVESGAKCPIVDKAYVKETSDEGDVLSCPDPENQKLRLSFCVEHKSRFSLGICV